jgi:HK97 gp10 family phage protein
MDFSVKIEGLEKLTKQMSQAPQLINAELDKALFISAKKVEEEAKRSIAEGNKSGKIYIRRSVAHRASAAGEAPASDTGRLLNSIATRLQTNAKEALIVAGNSIVRYARFLEFGTSKMAARPFMVPALEKSKAFIRARLNEAVDIAIKKVTK